MRRNFSAFTLAEVLITLGIIGVVAAMTMPTLMNSTQGAQYKAAYKKALSAIAQGVTLNVALDGASFADVVKGTAGKTEKGKCSDSATTSDCETVGSILNSRMNIVKVAGSTDLGYTLPEVKAETCTTTDGKETCTEAATATTFDTYLFLNDGIMFGFNSTEKGCTNPKDAAEIGVTPVICHGVIDVNGQKGPNKLVTCDNGTSGATCKVSNPTDVYPVEFYDQTVLPASAAAKAVLYGK